MTPAQAAMQVPWAAGTPAPGSHSACFESDQIVSSETETRANKNEAIFV